MGRFQFGQIVYARVSDGYGNDKPRPALVISGDQCNDAGEALQLLAISTTPDHTCPPYHIEITASAGHRLNPGSRVKCNWIRDVEQHDVIKPLGWLDDDTLERVVNCFDRLYGDDLFDDWQ